MRFSDILRTAFINLWRRKLRTFLTVLGMVIGVASIVVMISLGLGIQESVLNSFASTGSLTTIEVSSINYSKEGSSAKYEKLDDDTIEKILALDGVDTALPMNEAYAFLISGKYSSDITILGVDVEKAEEFGFSLAQGSLPEKYTGGSKYEIVLGSMTLETFINMDNYSSSTGSDGVNRVTLDSRFKLTFDPSVVYKDYEQSSIKGRSYNVTPTGIMSIENNDFAWHCIMDIDALTKLAKQNKEHITYDEDAYSKLYVRCSGVDDVEKVSAQIADMGFGTFSLLDAVQMAQQQTDQIRYLLAAIGFVSLLIAAIGIINTMMMSIYERTKEIGIIKVIGCSMKNILEMFLAEAAYIGLFGGVLGLLASYALSALLNSVTRVSGFVGIIPAYLAVGAVAFSIVVALVSGIYPATRAMRLSPLTAIRNE